MSDGIYLGADLQEKYEPGVARLGMPLSPREEEALRELSYGHSYGMIAHHMDITVHTVKSHLKRVFVKLGARNAAHAVRLGYSVKVLLVEEGEA